MAAQKSKYAGVGGARAQRPANYFRPGAHILWRLAKVEEGEDKSKTMLVAANGAALFTFADSDPSAHRVGEEISEVIKRSNVAFEGRLKALAMAIGDLTEADFDQQEYDGQIFDELVSEEQPAAGVILEVRASKILKQAAAEKPEDQRTAKDYYTRVDFVRRVAFSEVQEIMLAGGVEQEAINRLVPGIADEIAAEAADE